LRTLFGQLAPLVLNAVLDDGNSLGVADPEQVTHPGFEGALWVGNAATKGAPEALLERRVDKDLCVCEGLVVDQVGAALNLGTVALVFLVDFIRLG
jgi:hypothetical protein